MYRLSDFAPFSYLAEKEVILVQKSIFVFCNGFKMEVMQKLAKGLKFMYVQSRAGLAPDVRKGIGLLLQPSR